VSDTPKHFKTKLRHRKLSHVLRFEGRPDGHRPSPEVVVLEAASGSEAKPPVRIYLGTEPRQFRAERVFVWSIDQVRDPARRYEINLMKDLAGFDRHDWKTGFTNFRYAIPLLAGGQGRAIYNDVDQIYLSDPAELFDLDMQGCGQMSITRRETSVMLLDCEKMLPIWDVEAARHGKRHKHFRAEVAAVDGLWRQLPGIWNARDDEFVEGESKLLHYTTLQTQPWQPFPEQLKYRHNPNGHAWERLEKVADEAGYTVFTRDRPSRRHAELLERYAGLHRANSMPDNPALQAWMAGEMADRQVRDVSRRIQQSDASSILHFLSGRAETYGAALAPPSPWKDVSIACFDPACERNAASPGEAYDGVICIDALHWYSDEDIPWLLDEMFRRARRFVYASIDCYPSLADSAPVDDGPVTVAPASWWREQMEGAARRCPGVPWTLRAHDKMLSVSRSHTFSGQGLAA